MFKLFSHINRLITKFKIMIVGCNHPHPHIYILGGGFCRCCNKRLAMYDY